MIYTPINALEDDEILVVENGKEYIEKFMRPATEEESKSVDKIFENHKISQAELEEFWEKSNPIEVHIYD